MKKVIAISKPSPSEVAFVWRGRAAFEERFPGQVFEHKRWCMRHLKQSAAGQGNSHIYFTRIDDRDEELPVRYAVPIKAHLAVCGKEPGTLYNRSTAVRWLWEVLMTRLGGQGGAFSWDGLTIEDVENAEQKMLDSGMKPTSVYRRCMDLMAVLNDLSSNGLISVLSPNFQTAREDSADRQTLEGMEARQKLMPSEEAVMGMADVYQRRDTFGNVDRLCACATAVMFATSLRIIEVLELTLNCLRQDGKKWFLHCLIGKGRREEKISLSASQATLAKEALDEAIALTADARRRARVLVASPDALPLPKACMKEEWLSREVVAELLGITVNSTYALRDTVIIREVDRQFQINRASFQRYLQVVRTKSKLESSRGFAQTNNGKWLPLDSAIFLTYKNEGHARRGTNRLLVNLLTEQKVGTFLGGHGNGLPSIFERLQIKERNGTVVSINAHQIRHYVTTKASSAGVCDTYLARWQRRKDEAELQAYKHLTREERISRLKAHIRSGALQGEIADMYFALANSERDVFLDHVVQAIHLTHLGFCIHDFNVSPCPKALNCVGCGSFLFDPKDPSQRDQVLRLLRGSEQALEDALAAQVRGEGLLVDEWVNMMRATIDGLRTILKAKPHIDITLVAPFSDQPSKFQPVL